MGRRVKRGEFRRMELFTEGGTFGPQSKGWITFMDGKKLVKDGKAESIIDRESGEVLGYLLKSAEVAAPRAAKPTMSISESVLTRQEVDAVVGEHFKGGENIFGVNGGAPGQSQTAGMSAKRRKVREALGLEPVDFVEASRFKLNAFYSNCGRVVRVGVAA